MGIKSKTSQYPNNPDQIIDKTSISYPGTDSMNDLGNYLTEIRMAVDPSRLISEKWHLLLLIFAWGDAMTSVGAAFMSKMIPLRRMAVLNNIFGWSSGFLSGSLATLVKHSINFPLNIRRWRQMRQLIEKVQSASNSDLNVDWLKPFMHTRFLKSGQKIFATGDHANEAFVIISGKVELVERLIILKEGALFGEMALFTEHGKRTATAICRTDVTLSLISYESFEQLYFQNPEFGLYLVRLIAKRFQQNHAEAERQWKNREAELLKELSLLKGEAARSK